MLVRRELSPTVTTRTRPRGDPFMIPRLRPSPALMMPGPCHGVFAVSSELGTVRARSPRRRTRRGSRAGMCTTQSTTRATFGMLRCGPDRFDDSVACHFGGSRFISANLASSMLRSTSACRQAQTHRPSSTRASAHTRGGGRARVSASGSVGAPVLAFQRHHCRHGGAQRRRQRASPLPPHAHTQHTGSRAVAAPTERGDIAHRGRPGARGAASHALHPSFLFRPRLGRDHVNAASREPFLFPLPHRFFTPAADRGTRYRKDRRRREQGRKGTAASRRAVAVAARQAPPVSSAGLVAAASPTASSHGDGPPCHVRSARRPVLWDALRERGGGGGETAAFGAGRGDLRRCARLAIYSGCKSAALGLCAVTLSRAHGARRGRDGTGCAGVIGNARHAAGSLSRARAFCMMRGGTWACSGHGPVSEVC